MSAAQLRRPLVVAHRGIHHRYPENSLEAFRVAWESGIAWCECDVHASADGVPVVIHDATLQRTTTGAGRVIDFTWSQLRELRLRDGAGNVTDDRLPSLEAVIAAMPRGCGMLVELKPPQKGPDAPRAEALARRVTEMLPDDGIAIQSFEAANVRTAARREGRRCELLIDRVQPGVELDGPWSAINTDHEQLTAIAIAAIRGAAKRVGVWTPSIEPDVRRVIGFGVDTIISDDPHLVRRLLRIPSPGVPGEGARR